MKLILIVNIIGFLLMGLDKLKAKQGWWRIPESLLFTLALFFGAGGIFIAMHLFRHKTRHLSFRRGIPILLLINVILIYFAQDFLRHF